MSVWYWDKNIKYYLSHPWVWFKELFFNIKCMFERAKYGFSKSDIYDLDTWTLELLASALDSFADEKQKIFKNLPHICDDDIWIRNMATKFRAFLGEELINSDSREKLLVETFSTFASNIDNLWI